MRGKNEAFWKRRRWLWLVVVVSLAVVPAVLFFPRAGSAPHEEVSLSKLEKEIIPAAGSETPYGIPLSWDNAARFAAWYNAIDLSSSEAKTLHQALSPIPTPCCDDTRLLQCCCEESGQICNLVRSARGLAGWLIQQQRFSADETAGAVKTWVTFAHRGYYLAKELGKRGFSPARYALTTKGSCYRSACNLPLRQGGCGGMGSEVGV